LKVKFLFLIFLLAISSCSVGPPYIPPSIEVPPGWKNTKEEKCQAFQADENGELVYLDNWWEVFEDEKLEELEALAVKNNRNLFVAFERIQEYRALMGIAEADLYPQITLNPQTMNTVSLIKVFSGSSGTGNAAVNSSSLSSTANSCCNAIANAAMNTSSSSIIRAHQLLYLLPVNMSYEVDLWGKIWDQYQSARYNWRAIERDFDVVMLNLTTSLATAYYQVRVADAQIDLLLKVLKTRQKALEINTSRFEGRITFYADVTLASEDVDTVLNQYQEVSRQRSLLEDQIAVLIGVPASEFHLEHIPLTGLPPCIPAGIPSDVLLRRPDIAEAEYNTRAEHALVKQAYTLFLPSLILTAAGGFESPVLRDFLKWISRYWTDGLQINQILFDGGRITNNLKLQIARFLEGSGTYQQLVLTAFQEVEDALANIDSYAKEYDIAVATTQWAQITYQLYLDRYLAGVTYYIDVANTERDLLNFQISVLQIQGFRYLSTIQLIKALGGGWGSESDTSVEVDCEGSHSKREAEHETIAPGGW
jgi:outer membrane protein, multidrug efflux system